MCFEELLIFPLDIEIFWWINGLSGRFGIVDSLMIIVSSTWLWVAFMTALLSFCLLKKKWELLFVILISLAVMGIADLISFEIIKQWVKQDRPCWMFHGVNLPTGSCGGSYGFTSNHAANGAAFAAALWLFSSVQSKWLLSALIVLPLLVGFSRIFLGVHFPLDVIGGFALGFICAMVSKVVLVRLLSNRYSWIKDRPNLP